MSNIFSWLKKNILEILIFCVFIFIAYEVYLGNFHKSPVERRDFKDGIQNHLVWSIKNECYFVHPQVDDTVYLVRVQDCDRK